jgi:calcineurin-like phosphoesterase family protein
VTAVVWRTADLHFRHPNCAMWRGFITEAPDGGQSGDAPAHDRQVAANIAALVRPGDELHLHGDLGLKNEALILGQVADLPGIKTLYLGNHDRAHPLHRGWYSPARQARWQAVFGPRWSKHGQTVLAGRPVQLSHFPYAGGGDHTEQERFADWRLPDEGHWLLCGHVHEKWLIKGRMINVGLDQWGLSPVPDTLLAQIIDAVEHDGAAEEDVVTMRDQWLAAGGFRPPS